MRLDERRPAHRPVGRRSRAGQQRRVTPERRRSELEVGAQRLGLEDARVVLRFDRPEALATHVSLVGRLERAASATAKPAQRGDLPDGGRHVRSPLKMKRPPEGEACKYRWNAKTDRAQPPKRVAGPAMGAIGMDIGIR